MSTRGFPITIVIANPQPTIKIAGESDVIIVNYAVRQGIPGNDGTSPDITDPNTIAGIIAGLANRLTESELYLALRERLNLIDQGPTSLITKTDELIASTEQLTLANATNAAGIAQETFIRETETGELYAQYTIKIDNNGRISGFGLASSPTASEFIIRADKFAIIDPDADPETGEPVIPFIVDNGLITMNDAVILNLTADNIAAHTITTDHIAYNTIETGNIDLNAATSIVYFQVGGGANSDSGTCNFSDTESTASLVLVTTQAATPSEIVVVTVAGTLLYNFYAVQGSTTWQIPFTIPAGDFIIHITTTTFVSCTVSVLGCKR